MYRKILFSFLGAGIYYEFSANNFCCGIVGVLSSEEKAQSIIYEGVQLLQNRGYDSAGIGTITRDRQVLQHNSQLLISKYASDHLTKVDCFKRLEKELEKHQNSVVGIGHTRWATCGSKTDNNAHPHSDEMNRIALVHNGTLENYVELREQLLEKGVQFRSETDSEVIAQMIGMKLREEESQFLGAVEFVLEQLHGQWGLAIIDRLNPEQMIVCRQGSPILVGYNENSIFVASEKIAFEKYTQNYIQLQDGEVMLLSIQNRNQLFNQVKHRVIQNEHQFQEQVHIKPKAPFNSFFEMEIQEQPNSVLRCLGNGGRLAGLPDCSKLGGLDMKLKELSECKHLILLGCGSSFNAALSVLPILRGFRIFESVQAIEGSEFQLHDLPQSQTCGIFISQSGETKDLVRVLNLVKQEGVITIGVVNVVGSVIATEVDCGVYLNCGREVGVAASKSFTSQVVGLILISLWFSHNIEKISKLKQNLKPLREKYVNQLRLLPMVVGQCLVECQVQVKLAAKYLTQLKDLIILGKGSSYAIAREGALKIKELTYIHAEAFCAGELKHGPLALIDCNQPKSTAIVLIMMEDENLNDMKLSLSEVHSRNAKTIVITDSKQSLNNVMDKIDILILIPKIGLQMNWLLSVIVFQLLSLEICQLLNTDPDKPRNLAKTVTVG